MPRKPRLTSELTQFRNRAIGVMVRPFRWFSPPTQLIIGFITLVLLTTWMLTGWSLELRDLVSFALVLGSYFCLLLFVDYRRHPITQLISKRRVFALAGSAILVQTTVVRVGFMIASSLASQSTRTPLNRQMVWAFGIPFAAASLLVTMLLDRQLGMIVGVVASIFGATLIPNPAPIVFYSLASCAAAAFGIKRYSERQSVTLAGLIVAVVNCVAALVMVVLLWQPLSLRSCVIVASAAISGGFLTIIFASGGVPINESLFGVVTDVRLLELSNADLPILSQLALRAPGTNQHSHAVGQLAEDACRAIGANVLLARIGSLYHDIGKVAAPDYFVENQTGVNPHDRLRPATSAKIITSHVSYGVRLAHEIGLPKQVADFIPQHHGTRTLHFFLRKAQEQAVKGEQINEYDFRYPGPKPQFKEAAILMLADSCEAGARSLAHPDNDNISEIVARIFEAVRADGQLADSKLTAHEIEVVHDTLIKSLAAIYHPRIDYPGFNVPASEAGAYNYSPLAVGYEKASQVPINPSGEVEDEAIRHS